MNETEIASGTGPRFRQTLNEVETLMALERKIRNAPSAVNRAAALLALHAVKLAMNAPGKQGSVDRAWTAFRAVMAAGGA